LEDAIQTAGTIASFSQPIGAPHPAALHGKSRLSLSLSLFLVLALASAQYAFFWAVKMAKECVNKSYETTLAEGVRFERRVFHSTFATVLPFLRGGT
jgi:hypothetical protein